MDSSKRNRLAEAGWSVGDAQDFLGLSDEEAAFVEASDPAPPDDPVTAEGQMIAHTEAKRTRR